MKCLLFKYFSTQDDEELLNYYICFHQVNQNNYYFKDLFSLDTNSFYSKYCDKYKKLFSTCTEKSNHIFLQHYQQIGGDTSSSNHPIDIFKRGPITFFSINISAHSNSYNFFDGEKAIDNLIENVRQKFVTSNNVEVQGSVYLVNYQPAQSNVVIELEDKRIWLTDVYHCVF